MPAVNVAGRKESKDEWESMMKIQKRNRTSEGVPLKKPKKHRQFGGNSAPKSRIIKAKHARGEYGLSSSEDGQRRVCEYFWVDYECFKYPLPPGIQGFGYRV